MEDANEVVSQLKAEWGSLDAALDHLDELYQEARTIEQAAADAREDVDARIERIQQELNNLDDIDQALTDRPAPPEDLQTRVNDLRAKMEAQLEELEEAREQIRAIQAEACGNRHQCERLREVVRDVR